MLRIFQRRALTTVQQIMKLVCSTDIHWYSLCCYGKEHTILNCKRNAKILKLKYRCVTTET